MRCRREGMSLVRACHPPCLLTCVLEACITSLLLLPFFPLPVHITCPYCRPLDGSYLCTPSARLFLPSLPPTSHATELASLLSFLFPFSFLSFLFISSFLYIFSFFYSLLLPLVCVSFVIFFLALSSFSLFCYFFRFHVISSSLFFSFFVIFISRPFVVFIFLLC